MAGQAYQARVYRMELGKPRAQANAPSLSKSLNNNYELATFG